MSKNPIPYMSAPGAVTKILEKIKTAGTPTTFNADFLSTKLGFKGGNYRTFISWAKKMGLLSTDGTPTQLYKSFRNTSKSGASLAKAFKTGYKELYTRNEYCHDLDRKRFKGLVMEATGESSDSAKVDRIVSTFFNAKALADFDKELTTEDNSTSENVTAQTGSMPRQNIQIPKRGKKVDLGINYTINLVLPKTDDPAIYNAIFKSLRENLLNE